MNIHNNHFIWPNWHIVRIISTIFSSSYSVSDIFAGSSEEIVSGDKFVITGSQFYQRSRFDAGEIRIS